MPFDLSPVLASFAAFFPPWVRSLAILFFILNWRAWPLIWHFVVFKPVIVAESKRRWHGFTAYFKSKEQFIKDDEHFWTINSPVGRHPFDHKVVHHMTASFDVCDYNLHLSNSSYGKVFDETRFNTSISSWPQYLRLNGFIALAATHFHFIREIPLFGKYQIHVSFGGWDHKWVYVVGRFVTPKKPGSGKSAQSKNDISSPSKNPLSTTSDVDSSIDTPLLPNDITTTTETLRQATSALNQAPDGTVINTVSVSRLCFKMGRITIPPTLVFAINGFSGPSNDPTKPYSHENPPPHWQKVLELGHPRHGGSIKKMREFLKTGWRDVPESERWWEQAFAGPVEEQRKANMQALEGMRAGMDYFGTK